MLLGYVTQILLLFFFWRECFCGIGNCHGISQVSICSDRIYGGGEIQGYYIHWDLQKNL